MSRKKISGTMSTQEKEMMKMNLSPRRKHLEQLKRKFLNPDGTPKEGEESDTAIWLKRLEDQIVEEEEKEKLRKAFPTKLLRLCQLLKDEPELSGKLIEALESGVTFITITYQKGSQPNDMQHFWHQRGFPAWSDIVKWLKHIANDWKAKKFPTAELDNDGNWH